MAISSLARLYCAAVSSSRPSLRRRADSTSCPDYRLFSYCHRVDVLEMHCPDRLALNTTQTLHFIPLSNVTRNRLLAKERPIQFLAAVLGRGSHLSGSLSGIRPPSPVTRRRLGSPLHYQPADRAASQSPLLATVSRGYRPRGADRRSITEPFAVPIFTGMHGLISETSIYVRQNQPGVSVCYFACSQPILLVARRL